MGFSRHPLLGVGLALGIACANADAEVACRDANNTSGQNLLTGEFADFVRENMDYWNIPGMAIAVVDNNQVFAQGYGFSALPDKKVTPDTLFYAGSTTKAQTAACLSMLIKDGSYNALSSGWSTNISSILRDDFVLQDAWATEHITLDDAVCHRSGLPRHDRGLMRERNGVPLSTAEIVRNMRNLPYIHEPRTEIHYNNHMYIALSHVIETVTKKGLKQVMKEMIWNPLGMNSTYLGLADAKTSSKDLAKGYIWVNTTAQVNGTGTRPASGTNGTGQFKEATYMPLTDMSGAGAVVSNVRDYARWVRGLLNQTRALPDKVLRDIRAPRIIETAAPGGDTDIWTYGLGWYRSLVNGHEFFTHDGSMIGFKSVVYWLPGDNFGLVVFANADQAGAANRVIARKLITTKFNIPEENFVNVAGSRSGRKTSEQGFEEAVKKHYPNHTISNPSFTFKDMEGTYADLGYGNMTLRAGRGPKNETVLVAERPDMTWDYALTFRHIFGDHWIAGEGWRDNIVDAGQFHPVEFVKGAAGKPTALKMKVMAGFTWEGTVTFNKTA